MSQRDKPYVFKNAHGKKYVIRTKKIPNKYRAHGLCEPPNWKKPNIWLDERMSDRKRLSVAIEEMTHAFFWEKTEKQVKKFAARLAKFLYHDGWRRGG